MEKLEVVKREKSSKGECTPGLEKVFGVALLGALGSVLVYYLYLQLGEETRDQIRHGVVSSVKSQLAKWSNQ